MLMNFRERNLSSGFILPLTLLVITLILVIILIFWQMYEFSYFLLLRSKQIISNLDIAKEGINEVLMRQNSNSRYLFDERNYEQLNEEYAVLKYIEMFDKNRSKIGGVSIKIKPNPLIEERLNYNLEIAVRDRRGELGNIINVGIEKLDLMKYQYYSETSIGVSNGFYIGRLYAPQIEVLKGGINFWNRVEYVNWLDDRGSNFLDTLIKLPIEYPKLRAVIDFSELENATKKSNICGNGIGFYIGQDGFDEYVDLINKLFRIGEDVYFIDLDLLKYGRGEDFIEYNGVELLRYDGLSGSFNGIIYVDGDLLLGKSRENIKKGGTSTLESSTELGGECNLLVITGLNHDIYIEDEKVSLSGGCSLYLISGGVIYFAYPIVNEIRASLLALGDREGYSILFYNKKDFKKFDKDGDKLDYSIVLRGNKILSGMSILDILKEEGNLFKFYYDDELMINKNKCYPSIPIWRISLGTYKVVWENAEIINE